MKISGLKSERLLKCTCILYFQMCLNFAKATQRYHCGKTVTSRKQRPTSFFWHSSVIQPFPSQHPSSSYLKWSVKSHKVLGNDGVCREQQVTKPWAFLLGQSMRIQLYSALSNLKSLSRTGHVSQWIQNHSHSHICRENGGFSRGRNLSSTPGQSTQVCDKTDYMATAPLLNWACCATLV